MKQNKTKQQKTPPLCEKTDSMDSLEYCNHSSCAV